MSTRNSWSRITGSHRTRNIRKGLQARVADPLWMLCRQWQFGEFKGDDAASPVSVKVSYNSLPVANMENWPSDGSPASTRAIGDHEILEAGVEHESITDGPASLRVSAEAGIQFIRKLPATNRKAAIDLLMAQFPLADPATNNPGRENFLRLLCRKSFDGRGFFQKGPLFLAQLADEISIPLQIVEQAFAKWRNYYRDRFSEPEPGSHDAWQRERLEYRFGVSTSKGQQTAVGLEAKEYPGGRLDWYHFDLSHDGSKGLKREFARSDELTLIPTPVQYSGMPAARFWNFEDGKVFFGGLSADATDLAQLILTEFATVYSNDWFMVPVPVATGSLTRISRVEVWDAFDEKPHVIRPAASIDSDGGKDRVWRFFELSGDQSAESGFSPWLYVPRTVLGGYEDRPVEKVVFSRDEMANMAWGIEETLEGQSGHRVSRRNQWLKRRAEMSAYVGDHEESGNDHEKAPAWKYRFISVVPPYWIPFTAEIKRNRSTNRLIRGRMREWDLLGEFKRELAGAQGLILQSTAPMLLQEEEIPRGAIEVTRSYQAARDTAGNLVIWVGRKKRPASGNRSSGRETDKIETPVKPTVDEGQSDA